MNYKMNTIQVVATALLAMVLTGCQTSSEHTLGAESSRNVEQRSIVYEPENTYPIVNNHGNMMTYPDLKTMYEKADLVAVVQVNDQTTIKLGETSVGTRSNAVLKEIYKGEGSARGTSIVISEDGGIFDPSQVKGNETRIDPNHPPTEIKGLVEIALDGSTVMKSNQQYFVFLRKSGNPENGYNVVGVVQGKIKISEGEQLVATVDPKEFKEHPAKFILQSQFAGKSKQELVKKVKEMK
ncbi:hypothetical protein EV586_102734 [Tumebacillus sp. BK434]|uniref:hypothetical protein n=1 Tax=Tumebacillus sp. BK434 TaxID=2512169 RepID=UPI00104C25CD|nr:hypothetical protein [Tumebacillus sp. BK434]TCP58280.1 hypothetical protein EV586_102734 [Tumebacillus sp. BK434]